MFNIEGKFEAILLWNNKTCIKQTAHFLKKHSAHVKKHIRNRTSDNNNQNESLSLVQSITKHENNILQKTYTLLDKNGHEFMKTDMDYEQ